jgi:hypothetical protein
VPRNPRLKLKYIRGWNYAPDEAKQIFKRFLSHGYSPEEAAEATFAITGIMLTGGGRRRK